MVLTVKHEKQKIEKKTHCTHYTQTIGNVFVQHMVQKISAQLVRL